MMPVPPPKILELGTAVAATLLNVTPVMFAFVEVVFSHATPMITILSDPLPRAWDQLKDEMDAVDAALLAALNEICARTGNGKMHTARASATVRTNLIQIDLRGGFAGCKPLANIIRPPCWMFF